MLNKVTIMGRLCADPELRRTQSGIAVCNARIAVERNYADQDGERATDFYDVVAWRGTAEFLCKYFEKGRKILLDGHLQTRGWTAAVTSAFLLKSLPRASTSPIPSPPRLRGIRMKANFLGHRKPKIPTGGRIASPDFLSRRSRHEKISPAD